MERRLQSILQSHTKRNLHQAKLVYGYLMDRIKRRMTRLTSAKLSWLRQKRALKLSYLKPQISMRRKQLKIKMESHLRSVLCYLSLWIRVICTASSHPPYSLQGVKRSHRWCSNLSEVTMTAQMQPEFWGLSQSYLRVPWKNALF